MLLQVDAVCPLTPRPYAELTAPTTGKAPRDPVLPHTGANGRTHSAWDGGMEQKIPKVDCSLVSPTSTHIQHSLHHIPGVHPPQAGQPHLPVPLGNVPQEGECMLPTGIHLHTALEQEWNLLEK